MPGDLKVCDKGYGQTLEHKKLKKLPYCTIIKKPRLVQSNFEYGNVSTIVSGKLFQWVHVKTQSNNLALQLGLD